MINLTKSILLLVVFLPVVLFANVKERMKNELETIRGIMETYYTPAEWKYQQFGWLLDEEIEKAKARVDAMTNPDNKQFQRILVDFFNSCKDYHVQVRFNSTEYSTLPFSVKGVNGKYFVTYVDQNSGILLSKGDEIISFDGKPVQDIVDELILFATPSSNKSTDQSMAEQYLTHRFADKGLEVPKGKVNIEVKPISTGKQKKMALTWDHRPERIQQRVNGKSSDQDNDVDILTKAKQSISKLSPDYDRFDRLLKAGSKNEGMMGSKKSYIPPLGTLVWSNDEESLFHAYIYRSKEGKQVGYVRIPTYMMPEQAPEEFARIIRTFNLRTDAMVIDQINNPGGSVGFCFEILSMLTDRPLVLPKDRRSISHKDAAEALDFIDEFQLILPLIAAEGNYREYEFYQYMNQYFQFLVDEWNAGKTITDPFPDFGKETIDSNMKVHYKKPILVVINELDVSCGDLLPAILQDNNRATLFGSRTAGAGGMVLKTEFPNRASIKLFSYTGSLAERLDGTYIENLGITPDISYNLTERDLKGGFLDYRDAINKAVNELIKNSRG